MNHEPFTFSSKDDLLIHGDIFYRERTDPVFIELPAGLHGGIRTEDGQFDDLQITIADFLTNAGFAVAFIDKRGSRGHGQSYFQARDFCRRSIDDIVLGTMSLLKNLHQDRAFLHGTSSSATEALCAALRIPECYKQVILTSGFYDVHQQLLYDERYKSIRPTASLVQHLSAEEIAVLSPLNSLALSTPPPLLIIHGQDDVIVPPTQSDILVNLLKVQKKSHRYCLLPSLQHTREASDPRLPTGKEYWQFLIQQLSA